MEHDAFVSLISRRQSVRSYLDRKVMPDLIEKCLEASRLSPSACNAQPWHFVAADRGRPLKELQRAAFHFGMNSFAAQAPVMVAVFSELPNIASFIGGGVKGIPYHIIDIGIAVEHFCLAAASLGLGTCMIGWFDKHVVKRVVEAPASSRPVLLITVGYPADDHVRKKTRKSLEEISGWGTYRGSRP